jgi:hypothetical protein
MTLSATTNGTEMVRSACKLRNTYSQMINLCFFIQGNYFRRYAEHAASYPRIKTQPCPCATEHMCNIQNLLLTDRLFEVADCQGSVQNNKRRLPDSAVCSEACEYASKPFETMRFIIVSIQVRVTMKSKRAT